MLVDDHKLIRDAIKTHIANDETIKVIGEASNGQEALDLLNDLNPDVVLLDIHMDKMDGIECSKIISEKYPNLKFIVLSMFNESLYIKQVIKNGASGYLLKHASEEEIINAIKSVHDGKTYYDNDVIDVVIKSLSEKDDEEQEDKVQTKLSARELEVLELILQEFSNQEIADQLFISNRTVDAHKRNLLEKTNSKNIAGLIRFAYENALFTTN